MTFRIITLGCKMNAYESEALKEQLIKDGFIESKEGLADLFFVNTCAVTAMAEKKDLKVVRQLSRDYPSSRIYVMGCSSQIHKERYLFIDGVKGVYGTNNRHLIDACIGKEEENSDHVNLDSRHFSFDPLEIQGAKHSTKAYLKIQDGCNNFCSYCIVPYTRGVSRSRKHQDVLLEAKRLIDNGYKEIIIGGIDVGSYLDPFEDNYRLKDLLKDMVDIKTDKEFRIRVSSIELSQIDDDYIQLFKENLDRLCPHFHIPLQSGSERILRMMNRKYDLSYFSSTVDKIKTAIPKVGLSTDVILGFPNEDEESFKETYEFIQKIGFLRIHAFPYSEREGTPAAAMKKGIVPISIRKERTNKIIALGKELEQKYRKAHAFEEVKVLIEEEIRPNIYKGYSENYLEFEVSSLENIIDTFQTAIIN